MFLTFFNKNVTKLVKSSWPGTQIKNLMLVSLALPITFIVGTYFVTYTLITSLLNTPMGLGYPSTTSPVVTDEITSTTSTVVTDQITSNIVAPMTNVLSNSTKVSEHIISNVVPTVREQIISTSVGEQLASNVLVSSMPLTEQLVSSLMTVSAGFVQPQYLLKLWNTALVDFNLLFNGITISVVPLFLNVGIFCIVVQQQYGSLLAHLVTSRMITHPLANDIMTVYASLDTRITDQFIVYNEKIRHVYRHILFEIRDINQLYVNVINTYSENIYLNRLTLKIRSLCREIFDDMALMRNHHKAMYIYQWIQKPTLLLFLGLPRLLLLSIMFFFSSTLIDILDTNPEHAVIYNDLLDFVISILKRIFE